MKNEPIYYKAHFMCLLGVDEAGRGPLAGPLSVGAVMVENKKVLREFSGVKDSKKLSEKKREEWFEKIRIVAERGILSYEVAIVDSKKIDEEGISSCLKDGVRRALAPFVSHAAETLVLLDGTLHASKEFPHQVTIIKGDEKERIIAMASIVAKVTRDRLMVAFGKKYPEYGFEIHKGYGTSAHYEAIRAFGISPIHRRSFLILENRKQQIGT